MNTTPIRCPVSVCRTLCSLGVVALSAMATPGSAQQSGIDIRRADTSATRAVPGQVLAIVLHITNTESTARHYQTEIRLPTGWRLVTYEKDFELPASSEDTKILSVSVPRETPAGRYAITYAARDDVDSLHSASTTIAVFISPVRLLSLILLEAPRFIAPGESFQGLFRISNDGNVPGLVRMSILAASGETVQLDSSLFFLNPKESRNVAATAIVDASVREHAPFHMEALADFAEDSTIAARASCDIDVIPRVPAEANGYREFPVQATLRATAGNTSPSGQIELSGAGSLSEQRRDRLEMMIRTPDTQPHSILGLRDEYRAGYHSRPADVYMGDANFTLSPLTELGRYAFGAGGRATLEGVTFGGFHNQNRFLSFDEQEEAGFMGCHIGDGSDVSINYLRKHGDHHSNTITLRSDLQLATDNDVDVEYGVGYADGNSGNALAVQWGGRKDWIAYDLQYIDARPHYTGYYRDLNLRTASISIFPTSSLRFEGYARDEDRNLDRDPFFSFAPRDRYFQFGAGYGDLVAAYYRIDRQEDQLPQPKYQREEDVVQVRLGYNTGIASLLANIEQGTTRDRILGTSGPFQRYSLIANVRATDLMSYSASAEYSHEQSIYSLDAQERVSGGLATSILLDEGTHINASITGSHIRSSYPETYYLADFIISHTFPFKHTLSLRGRQNLFASANGFQESAYVLEYTIPFGIPVLHATSGGQFCGTITDESTGSGIPNIILYAEGLAALSDNHGEFCFPSLKPGSYSLQLDMTSVGLHRVTSRPLPGEFVISEGEETRVSIGIVQSASFSGTIRVFDFVETQRQDSVSDQLIEVGRQKDALVEMTHGSEVSRRITDSRGRFSFDDLRPGRWTFRVLEDNPPSLHYFDTTTYRIELTPASRRELTIKLLPRRRKIQIIQEGRSIEEVRPDEKKDPAQPIQNPRRDKPQGHP